MTMNLTDHKLPRCLAQPLLSHLVSTGRRVRGNWRKADTVDMKIACTAGSGEAPPGEAVEDRGTVFEGKNIWAGAQDSDVLGSETAFTAPALGHADKPAHLLHRYPSPTRGWSNYTVRKRAVTRSSKRHRKNDALHTGLTSMGRQLP